MSANDGGPAFPKDVYDGDLDRAINQTSGMSLRDYFAAKAMAAWLSTFTESRHPADCGTCHEVAKGSYQLADAMLAERAK